MMLVAMAAVATTIYQDGTEFRLTAVVIGFLVFGLALVFEAIADLQLNAFVAKRSDQTEILTSGLWHYSRHPNYFGEVTAWWGLWIIATAPAIANPTNGNLAICFLALISPVTITVLILMVSGIPMIEAKYVGNQNFDAYKRKTSAFFPWFPRRLNPRNAPALLAYRPDQPSSNSS